MLSLGDTVSAFTQKPLFIEQTTYLSLLISDLGDQSGSKDCFSMELVPVYMPLGMSSWLDRQINGF